MNRLKNKIAIVTGAASGIGRGIALAFAAEGAKVLVADINEAKAGETAAMIKKQKGEALFIKTDVSKASEVEQMVNACLEAFKTVDILVNNAGIVKFSFLEKMEENDWDKVIEVNLKSVFLGSKAVLPHMLEKESGKIINIASIAGLVGYPQTGAYCASKGGIVTLTKSMALDYAPKGINVNCIAPGVIETAMTEQMLKDPEQRKSMERVTPYKRFGKPDDIAMAAVYLASEESDFVNGEVLAVDGGHLAQ